MERSPIIMCGNVHPRPKSALLTDGMADGTQGGQGSGDDGGRATPLGHAHTLPSAAPPVSGTRPRASSRGQSVEMALAKTMQSGAVETVLAPPAEAPSPLSVGDVIGDRYVIEEHISSGGFGAVYRASDKQIRHHQVALKLLHTPAADEAARAHAMRELTLIASVSHPSVVQFKDYGWLEGRLWFAMPWYRGETLDQRYAGMAMTPEEARPIFERLAMGLAAMHEVGIEHHDIKPENIFLADIAGFEGGLPVLLDLGIAGEQGEGPRGLTLDYAAPETARQALGEKVEVGAAADVFSLALVLRNMLEPPEVEEGEFVPLALLHTRATQAVEGLASKRLRYLQPSMMRWLDPDPFERPSAHELADELAILTAPQEARAARNRFLKRLIPVLAVAAGLVALLWFQLRESKTQLTVQQEKLSEQMHETAVLRDRSETQLGQLEEQMARIGSQQRELTRAIGIARELDKQLERTESQREKLSRRARGLTGERDGLIKELAELDKRHAALQSARDALQKKHDGVSRERDGLAAERARLLEQRTRLEQRATSLEATVELGKRRLSSVQGELGKTRERRKILEKNLGALEVERDRLAKAMAELKLELEAQRAENRKLKKRQRGARKVDVETKRVDPVPTQ